ncbi:MAG TPA: pyruvate kinase alpha/beta domain-containing protein, partial [Patescibacteria group bacterium]|nr:pyruvate kinase alpha/beta domain-containing protein [Patescibacteria group bacterium]
ASGKYPVEAVATMAKIVRETEASTLDDLDVMHKRGDARSVEEAVSEIANVLVRDVDTKLILVASALGDLARIVSRFRPETPILVATDDARVMRQLCLSWGILPVLLERASGAEEFFKAASGAAKKLGLVASGDKVVVVGGEPVGALADRVEIREVP